MKKNADRNRRKEPGQFALLKTKRFAPFFATQFFGAFNDNVFKNALMIFLAYQAAAASSMSSGTILNLAAGLFILPFFLFSATAGQIADKYEKSRIARKVKLMEIGIMVCVPVAFFLESVPFLLGILFLMGTQSTLFGPVKYSIMPQHLHAKELVGGNAMVEMGTFAAILLGTITGGVLIQATRGPIWVGMAVVGFALLGWAASRHIPEAKAASPELKISFNPCSETLRTIRMAMQKKSVWLAILAISWFWFLGAAYLTQLPAFAHDVLHGSESVVTLLIALFSIGIGTGSILCERLSRKRVELGLVPLGALGLSLFGLDLVRADVVPVGDGLMGIQQFLSASGSSHVILDLLLIGIFGGLYIVPLFAYVQKKTDPCKRARVIAANNIVNALFMVLSALTGVFLLGVCGLDIPAFFLIIACMNMLITAYIFTVVPEFAARFFIWVLSHTIYRYRKLNMESIPESGPAVLVCNHVSYVDGLLVAGACDRPVRFVVYEPIYRLPLLHSFFKMAGAIPICSAKENRLVLKAAYDTIAKALEAGELVCIFPEGKLTRDGKMDAFKRGIEKIVQRNPVPVVPMALQGLWGSFFSHCGGKAMIKPPRRFWSRISIVAGLPLRPAMVSAGRLYEEVGRLKACPV